MLLYSPLCVLTWSIHSSCHYLLKCIDLSPYMWETKMKKKNKGEQEECRSESDEWDFTSDRQTKPWRWVQCGRRIILHNKRFILRLIIDSWSQARQHRRHIWALGAVNHRPATGGGGITVVIWQLPYLIQTLLLTLVTTKPWRPEQPCPATVWSITELTVAATEDMMIWCNKSPA